MDFKDYYQTLGVPKTASDKELKQAFADWIAALSPRKKEVWTLIRELRYSHELAAATLGCGSAQARTATPVCESWPGEASKRPAPCASAPVSNNETPPGR